MYRFHASVGHRTSKRSTQKTQPRSNTISKQQPDIKNYQAKQMVKSKTEKQVLSNIDVPAKDLVNIGVSKMSAIQAGTGGSKVHEIRKQEYSKRFQHHHEYNQSKKYKSQDRLASKQAIYDAIKQMKDINQFPDIAIPPRILPPDQEQAFIKLRTLYKQHSEYFNQTEQKKQYQNIRIQEHIKTLFTILQVKYYGHETNSEMLKKLIDHFKNKEEFKPYKRMPSHDPYQFRNHQKLNQKSPISSPNKQVESLAKQNATLSKQVEDLKRDIIHYEGLIEKEKKHKEEIVGKFKQRVARLQDLNKGKIGQDPQILKLREQVNRLKLELSAKKAPSQLYNSYVNEEASKYKSLQKQCRKLEDENRSISEQIKNKDSIIKGLKSERMQKQSETYKKLMFVMKEKKQIEDILKLTKKQLQTLKQQNTKLEQTTATLKQLSTTQSQKLKNHQNKLIQKQQRIIELSLKLTQKQNDFEKKREQVQKSKGFAKKESSQIGSTDQKMDEEDLLSRSMCQKLVLKDLIPSQILYDRHQDANYLKDLIQKIMRRKIKKTKMLFTYDPIANQRNIHKYIDLHPNILLVLQLQNGQLLGAFSEARINKQQQQKNRQGIIFSITKRKHFQLKSKKDFTPIRYNPYHLQFGNGEIRMNWNHANSRKVASLFGTAHNFFYNQGYKRQFLFGTEEPEPQFRNYEIFEIFFQ